MKVQCEIIATQLLAAPFGEVSTKYKIAKVFLGMAMLGGFAFFSAAMATPLGLTRTISVIATSAFVIGGLGLLGVAFYLEKKRSAKNTDSNEFKQRVTELQKEGEALRQQHKELSVAYELQRSELDRLQREHEKLYIECDQLKREQRSEEWEAERSRLDTQLQQKKAELEQASLENQRITEEYNRVLSQMQDAYQREMDTLKAMQMSAVDAEMDRLQSENNALRERHEQLQRKEEELHRGHQEELLRYRSQLEQTQLELQQATGRISEGQQNLSRIEQIHRTSIEEVFRAAALQEKEAVDRYHRLQTENANLELQLQEARLALRSQKGVVDNAEEPPSPYAANESHPFEGVSPIQQRITTLHLRLLALRVEGSRFQQQSAKAQLKLQEEVARREFSDRALASVAIFG